MSGSFLIGREICAAALVRGGRANRFAVFGKQSRCVILPAGICRTPVRGGCIRLALTGDRRRFRTRRPSGQAAGDSGMASGFFLRRFLGIHMIVIVLMIAGHKAALSGVMLFNNIDNITVFLQNKLLDPVNIKRMQRFEEVSKTGNIVHVLFRRRPGQIDHGIEQRNDISRFLLTYQRYIEEL